MILLEPVENEFDELSFGGLRLLLLLLFVNFGVIALASAFSDDEAIDGSSVLVEIVRPIRLAARR